MIQAIGSIATTIGVLIALYIAVIRDPGEGSEEHRHHVAQMDALARARADRARAQAEKLVASCARAPLLGDSWWTARIDNASSAVTTILSVDVTATDPNGVEIIDGCHAPPRPPIPSTTGYKRSQRSRPTVSVPVVTATRAPSRRGESRCEAGRLTLFTLVLTG